MHDKGNHPLGRRWHERRPCLHRSTFEIGTELDPAKKHGQRSFTWPNEDTNGRHAKRFLKRKAAKEARRYLKREDRKTDPADESAVHQA